MNRLGRRAEEFAVRTLLDGGYRILAVNHHSIYGEIDVIAADLTTICFVEVKARNNVSIDWAARSVTPSKQRKIIRTALLYLQETGCELQPRFDVFCVQARGDEILRYEHMKGAFDGGAYY